MNSPFRPKQPWSHPDHYHGHNSRPKAEQAHPVSKSNQSQCHNLQFASQAVIQYNTDTTMPYSNPQTFHNDVLPGCHRDPLHAFERESKEKSNIKRTATIEWNGVHDSIRVDIPCFGRQSKHT
jgi:hypothetical protein